MVEENKINEEQEIVTPEDFKLQVGADYFICPNCNSKAIVLDKDFEKNNIANSIIEENTNKTSDTSPYAELLVSVMQKCPKIVLKCTNCNRRDLMVSFLENRKGGIITNNPWDIGERKYRPPRIHPMYKPKYVYSSKYNSLSKI